MNEAVMRQLRQWNQFGGTMLHPSSAVAVCTEGWKKTDQVCILRFHFGSPFFFKKNKIAIRKLDYAPRIKLCYTNKGISRFVSRRPCSEHLSLLY